VKVACILGPPLGLAAVVGLAGCFTTPPPSARSISTPETTPSVPPPSTALAVPDTVPRVEPRSRYGNPLFYEIFGKRYYVLASSADYVERGVASWYGPGFHKIPTSTGETYDMYAMTAAHKTLPLPANVRVTNLQNGRSVVVRVNDRGPFVGNRIIDLSYAAASRLDMLHDGTAMVEVRAIDPSLPPRDSSAPLLAGTPIAPSSSQGGASAAIGGVGTPASQPATTPVSAPEVVQVAATAPALAPRAALFVQAGAFADPANAERLAAKLRGGSYGKIFVRDDLIAGRRMYRVRIGPVAGVPQFDRIVAALDQAGVHDAHLALD
jgi:rare lipoprotein A